MSDTQAHAQNDGLANDAATDARTPPVAVWQILGNLKGQDLLDWRLAETKGRASVAERNLDIGIPFGWYPLILSSELAVGEVKPLRYFAQDLAIWRGEDGQVPIASIWARTWATAAKCMATCWNARSTPGAMMATMAR